MHGNILTSVQVGPLTKWVIQGVGGVGREHEALMNSSNMGMDVYS